MEANESVLKTIADAKEPLKAGEIAAIAGIDKKDVDKALKALKKEGKIDSPKRCYYSIPE